MLLFMNRFELEFVDEFGRNTIVDIDIKELSSYIYDDARREEACIVAKVLHLDDKLKRPKKETNMSQISYGQKTKDVSWTRCLVC